MKINLQVRHMALNDGLQTYIQRRLDFALGSRYAQIQHIDVTLSDINGPRGGEDKSCKIRVSVAGQPDVVIDEVQHRLEVAIDRAASRASRAVTRRLSRLRNRVSQLNKRSRKYIELEHNDYLSASGER